MRQKMPPLQWLRSFEAAARRLSFTEAAEELHLTQSAVSQQVKHLESFLGQALFIRRPRSLQLTDAARSYLPTVQSAFKLLVQGTDSFFGNDSDTMLEVKANWAFTALWLVPRIDAFVERNPWVQMSLQTALWDSEYTAPHATVEVRFGSGQWEGPHGERLTEPLCYPVCAPRTARFARRAEDIVTQPLLHVTGMLDGWHAWLRSLGLALPSDVIHHRSSTLIVTLALARQGLGIALAHDVVARGLLDSGELVAPVAHALPMRESYYLLTPDSTQMNNAARVFTQWLQEQFVVA